MKKILYILMFFPLLGFAQGQVDCSLLSVTDVIIQNDSITFEIYNADTMDTHYPYVSYTLDANGDTIQKGQMNWYVTPAGTSSFYYYTNVSISYVMDSLTDFNVNYPLSIYFTYSNLTGENPGGYTCELVYDPLLGCTDVTALNYDSQANIDNGSCEFYNETDDCTNGYSITLQEGWNLFGYSCVESSSVVEVLSNIVDLLIIVKDNSGNAYLPEWNFNGIGNLYGGYGYQLKITEHIDEINICD